MYAIKGKTFVFPLCVLMIFMLLTNSVTFAQTNYYSKATGDPNSTSTWGTNTDGTGSNPTDFITNNQVFNLVNSNPGTMTAAWTVSGTNSKVIIGDGVTAQSLSTSTFLLTATVDVSATGTLNIQSNSTFTLGTCSSGSTVAYNGDLDQSVRTGTYHHLVLTNATAARNKTASGAITVNGDLTVNTNNTLVMTTNLLLNCSGSISGNGTISTTNTSITPIPNNLTWTQTIVFSATTSGVSSGTYQNLTVSTAGTKTVQGNLTVNGILNVTATLDMVTNTLSGNFTTSGTGTILTQNTSATPIPAGKTWTQNITYNANGSSQTVVKGVYNLALDVKGSGAGGNRTFPSNRDSLEVKGNFTANATSVTYTSTGTRFVFSGSNQTLTFSSTSPINFEWLTCSGTNTKTISGANISADTLSVSSTMAMQTNVLSGNLNSIIGAGTITTTNTSSTPIPAGKTWTQNITFSSTSSQTIPKGLYMLALNAAGASGSRVFGAVGDTIEVRGNFTASGTSITYTTAGRRFLFSTSSATLTFSATSSFSFDWVSFSGAITKTVAGAGFSADTFIVNTGTTLAMATFQLSGNLSSISGAGTITTTNTGATPFPAGKTWTQNITFSSTSSQTVPKGLYLANLSVSGASGSRVFPTNGDTIEVRGNFTAGGASITYTTTGTRFLFSGNAQTLTFSATSIFNFGLLSFTGSGFTKTVATAGFSFDTLSLPAGVTLNMVTFAIGGNANSVNGTGTIQTQCISNGLPSGKVWPVYVNYNDAAGTQNIIGGTYEKLTLSLSGTTARTKNVAGNITVNDSLVISTASTGVLTINFQTNKLLNGPSFQLINVGTTAKNIQTQSADANPFPAGLTWPTGTVTYNASGDQSVVSGTYSSITFSGTGNRNLSSSADIIITATLTASTGPTIVGGSSNVRLTGAAQTISLGAAGSFNNFRVQGTGDKTVTAATGTLTVDGELEVATGRTLIMNTNAIAGSISSTTGNGTITTTSTSATPLSAGKTWSMNVTFSSTSSQTIPKGLYLLNLNVAGAAGSRVFPTNADTVEVRGNFSANGATITYTTTGTRFVFSGNAQTLTFVSTSAFNFGFLSITGNGFTKTIAGTGFSADTVDIGTGAILNMVTFTMTGNVTYTSGAGTITTQSAAANPIPLAKVWSPTVNYNADATQNVTGGTYNKLIVSIAGTARTKTATGTITVNDTLTLLSTGAGALAFSMSTYQLINGGSFFLYNSGSALKNVTTNYTNTDTSQKALPTGQTWPGTVTFSSASHQTVPAGIYTNTLSVAGGARTFSAIDTIECRGAFTANTALTSYTATNTFFYFSSASQTLTFVSTSAFSFNHVSFAGTLTTKTIAGAGFNVNGILNIDTTVTLNMVTFALGGNPTGISGTGNLNTQCLLLGIPASKTWTISVNYNDAAGTQNIIGGTYSNITFTVNGTTARTKNATDSIRVNGVLTFSTNSTGGFTVTMNTFRLIDGVGFSFVNSGTAAKALTTSYSNTDTSLKPIPTGITWPGIVTYNAAGHQTVVSGIYTNNLIVTGGNRTFSAMGTIEVQGASFTANTASVTYNTSNTSFLFSGGAQTLTFISTSPFNFNHLSFTGTNVTKTIAGNGFAVNGNLNIASSVTLSMTTFLMTGNPQVISGSGIISITATSGTPLPIGEIWTQTVFYTANGSQTISGGEYEKLKLTGVTSGTRVKTVTGANLKVNDSLFFSSTGTGIITLEMGANQLIAGPSFTLANSGTTARNINTQSLTSPALPSGITWPDLSVVTFNAGAGTQYVPGGSFYRLAITSNSGKVATGNITVRNTLTMSSPNPSSTMGALDMGDSTLNLGTATITGTGDVTGIIRRTSMVAGTTYTFGQLYTSLNFANTGTIPSAVSFKVKIGSSPSWKSGAIQRYFQIAQTGAVSTSATLRLHYVDAEMNGNIENRLVIWRDSSSNIVELGRSTNDATNNYIEQTGIDLSVFPNSFGSDSLTLSNSQIQTIVWEGSVSNVWTNSLNWSTNITPDSTDNVTIPDSSSTLNDPQLPATARVSRLSIETNGYLTSVSGAQLTIYGNDSSGFLSWESSGTFNAGNSTVTFSGTNAGYNGITTFNNITIAASAKLTIRSGAILNIAGTITNNGTWDIDSSGNGVVNYSGNSAQTILTPNGAFGGYAGFTLSGSGTKTLPSSIKLTGDFTNSSTTSLIPGLDFFGSNDQSILGTIMSSVNVFNIANGKRVICTAVPLKINDSLKLTSGILQLGDSTILINGVITGTGTLSSLSTSKLYLLGATGTVRWVTDEDSLGVLLVNGTSGITLGSDVYVKDTISLTGSELSLNGKALYVLGDYLENSSTLSGSISSKLIFRNPNSLTSNVSFTSGSRVLNTLDISKPGSGVVMSTDLTCDSIALDTGALSLNGNTLTLTGKITGNGTITGSAASSLALTGAGSPGTLKFTTGAQQLSKLVLNRTGVSDVFLGSDLSVNDSLKLLRGMLHVSDYRLVVNGSFDGSDIAALSGGNNSILEFSGSGGADTLFFNQLTNGTTNLFDSVILNRSGIRISQGNDLVVGSCLKLISGQLSIDSNWLTLNGTLINDATNSLSSNGASSLRFNGSGALGNSVYFDQSTAGTTNKLKSIHLNRASQTITLGNDIQLSGALIPQAGTLATAGHLTLLSNADGTARITDGGCTTCSYITGNVHIQRFIPSVARRWRFIGSTVQSTTVNDWKDEIYVTGPGGNANGFDQTFTNAPSIFWYDETQLGTLNSGWTSPANSSATLPPGRGYRLFVRGDRSNPGRLTDDEPTQNSVTLDLNGVPNQGDIVMPVSCTFSGSGGTTYVDNDDGWCLLSNPYPCPYDWDAHFSDGNYHDSIQPNIWILDANSSNNYIAWNAGSHAGGLSSGVIPASASFWVKANGASPSLTFKEQFKVELTPHNIYKSGRETFLLKLYKDAINSDAVAIKYIAGSSKKYDYYDTKKLGGALSISAIDEDKVPLALSCRPDLFVNDTVSINMLAQAGEYQIQFINPDNIGTNADVLLEDIAKHNFSDIRGKSAYKLKVSEGENVENRFRLIIGYSLPSLLDFKANETEKHQVLLDWTVARTDSSVTYEIERKTNGDYNIIGNVDALASLANIHTYQFTDEHPYATNTYRLRMTDRSGHITYSEPISISIDFLSKNILAYPSPFKDFVNVLAGENIETFEVFDINGTSVFEQKVGNTNYHSTDLSSLQGGYYVLKIVTQSGNQLTVKAAKY